MTLQPPGGSRLEAAGTHINSGDVAIKHWLLDLAMPLAFSVPTPWASGSLLACMSASSVLLSVQELLISF